MTAVRCWVTREEAFGDDETALGKALDTMPADYHAPGLPPDHPETDPYGCVACADDWVGSMCDLDEGHAGEHVFVSRGSITLVFPSQTEDE